MIAWNIGLSEAAITEFTEAIRLNTNFTEAYLDRGRLKLNKGDLEGPLADFNKTIELKLTGGSLQLSRQREASQRRFGRGAGR